MTKTSDKKIRVGIIGTGWVAETHVKQYLMMPDVEIAAGADLVDGKAEEFFEKHGVKRNDSLIHAHRCGGQHQHCL